MLVDRLLPHPVVRARDGELAAEAHLGRRDLVVADDAVHHDVVRAARLVQRHRRLAVVELAARMFAWLNDPRVTVYVSLINKLSSFLVQS